jgi:hypothetical protein
MEHERVRDNLEYTNFVAEILYYLCDGQVRGTEETPGLPVICCELSISLLLLPLDRGWWGRWVLRALRRILDRWPEMDELLKATERGLIVLTILRDLVIHESRLVQANSLTVVMRVRYGVFARLPVDGKSGKARRMILEKMDKWVCEWYKKRYELQERELNAMREEGKTGASDVVLWESFLAYLKTLDHDMD